MEGKAVWNGRLTFTGTADSGFKLILGTDADVGGDEDGFRPLELVAIGLAGCTGMDVISILGKKRQVVTDFEVQVHARQADQHPMVFTEAIIEYFVTGHSLDEAAVLRSIELSSMRYCPVQGMLKKIMPIQMKYHIFEASGEGERTLVKSGVYLPVQDSI